MQRSDIDAPQKNNGDGVNNKPYAKTAIITRTKNRPVLLERCLNTVLAQSDEDWIHVVVNDGGDAAEVTNLISQYQDRYKGRVLLIHNDVSRGMEAASNIGIRACGSEFLVILDDDDSWAPGFLKEMTEELAQSQETDTMGAFCHTEIIYETLVEGNVIEEGRVDFNSGIRFISLPVLIAENRFVPVSFVFRRSAIEQVGYFDESLPVCGDWDFNIRFLATYEISVVKKTLAFYHQRRASVGDYGNTVISRLEEHEKQAALLVNRWVRQALADGTTNYAELFMLGKISDKLALQQKGIDKITKRTFVRRLKRFFHKIKS